MSTLLCEHFTPLLDDIEQKHGKSVRYMVTQICLCEMLMSMTSSDHITRQDLHNALVDMVKTMDKAMGEPNKEQCTALAQQTLEILDAIHEKEDESVH